MLSLTPSHEAAGWNANNHWLKWFLPTVCAEARWISFSASAFLPAQCSTASASVSGSELDPPPPGVCPVEGGKSARGRAREYGRDSRLPLSDSILPVAVAMETGECFSRVNSAALCTTSNAAAMIQAAARQGAPTTAEQSAYKAVCVRECVQGL